MRKSIHKMLLSLFCLFTLVWYMHAESMDQSTDARNAKLFRKAMQLADQANYKEAIELFNIIVKRDSKDLDALFNMGLCYLNTSNGADTAVICFNKGLEILTDQEKEGYLGRELGLSLGKAYQVLLKPLKAIEIYEKLLEHAQSQDSILIYQIEREIQICHHANFFINNPIELTVENMGSSVNSMYDDHSPLIGVSENQLFFTSRRNWIKLSLLADGQYAEKIYTVPLAANNWESARLLKVFFKQNEHEAAASLSPDGNELVLFRNDEHGKSLYLSHYTGQNWTEPEKLPFPINSHAQETHGSISADKSTFFFTSDRAGGLGGLDIYMTKKLPDGQWGPPRNLGPHINTEFDEETPMIHYDGKTLYFSSEGHNTMGRLDVFYSQMNTDSTWSVPVNLGYPINTPDDDFFFVPTINKSRAYYASSKFADNYGGSDIYQVKFNANTDTELAVIEGVIDSTLGTDYGKIRVLVTRIKDKKLVGDYRPNSKNGSYMMFLENGYEYEVKQTNINKLQKVAYINVTDKINYKKTKIPIAFSEVAMDAPLIKIASPLAIDYTLGVHPQSNSSVIKSTKTVIPHMVANVENVSRFMNEKRSSTKNAKQIKGYTLQLLALKEKPLPNLDFFEKRNILNVTEHRCSDGYTRYTKGQFESYKACIQLKNDLVKNNGMVDIWIRPIKDFELLKAK